MHDPKPSGLALRSTLLSHAPQWPCFQSPTQGLGRKQPFPDREGLRGPRSPCQRRRIPAVCRISPRQQWTGLWCLGASFSSAERNPWLNGVPTTRTKDAWNPGSAGPCLGHPRSSWLASIKGLAAPSLALYEVGPLSQDLRKGKAHSSTLSDLQIEPGAEDTWKAVENKIWTTGICSNGPSSTRAREDLQPPHDLTAAEETNPGSHACVVSSGELELRPHKG